MTKPDDYGMYTVNGKRIRHSDGSNCHECFVADCECECDTCVKAQERNSKLTNRQLERLVWGYELESTKSSTGES